MRMRIWKLVLCLATLGSLTPPEAKAQSSQAPATPIAVAFERLNPLGSKALGSATLASKRGGSEVFNQNKLKGVVADNQAINVTTGGNLITDGALTGAAGIPMVIQNSGNNVLIQNATIVNLQVK